MADDEEDFVLDFSSRQKGQKIGGDNEAWAVYSAMPDVQKRQLCIDLMAEFGLDVDQETHKGELRHRCNMPFGRHTDRDSITASVNYKKLAFRCWVCGARGGLLWWIAVNRGEDIEDSAEWLKEASGVADGLELPKLLEVLDALFNPKRERLQVPTLDERIFDQWRDWPIHHPYLTEPVYFSGGSNIGGREIPIENLDRFKIGFCMRDEDLHYYQRIMIPLWWKGDFVGWQARQVPEVNGWRTLLDSADGGDPQEMKFKFSPGVPREYLLYGTDEALSGSEALVVESGMSVLRHAHHLPIVGTLGAAVSPPQARALHRYEKVTFCLDNDSAGWDALTGTGVGKNRVPGLIEELADYVEVCVIDWPWWKADPADVTESELASLYRKARPAVLWKPPAMSGLQWYDRRGRAA